jgi:hypothetical protein
MALMGFIYDIEVEQLADAMWQLLDDMGANGLSVCLAAKVEARIAMEPFLTLDRPACEDWMTLATALQVMKESDRG